MRIKKATLTKKNQTTSLENKEGDPDKEGGDDFPVDA
jgi:hypothetical protein